MTSTQRLISELATAHGVDCETIVRAAVHDFAYGRSARQQADAIRAARRCDAHLQCNEETSMLGDDDDAQFDPGLPRGAATLLVLLYRQHKAALDAPTLYNSTIWIGTACVPRKHAKTLIDAGLAMKCRDQYGQSSVQISEPGRKYAQTALRAEDVAHALDTLTRLGYSGDDVRRAMIFLITLERRRTVTKIVTRP